jgi:hypothetical protein|tara:strand:- start:180 stop:284 length:105 start_codon:yes stop_codon:yes gene_type:complete
LLGVLHHNVDAFAHFHDPFGGVLLVVKAVVNGGG